MSWGMNYRYPQTSPRVEKLSVKAEKPGDGHSRRLRHSS